MGDTAETSRHFRYYCYLGTLITIPGEGAKGNTAYSIPPGSYCHGKIVVNVDGSVYIASDAYPDDIIAFVLLCIGSNPTMTSGIISSMRQLLLEFDRRAVQRHGFKKNPQEAALDWSTPGNLSVE